MKLKYGVNDRPKLSVILLSACQQLLSIIAGTMLVPAIVGHELSPSAALFGAGLSTLTYLAFTKFKSPVFLGSSFAFLGSMMTAFAGAVSMSAGYLGMIIGAVMAGLVYVFLAFSSKLIGTKWLDKLMPALVIGPAVAVIGLSLAANAVSDLSATKYIAHYDSNDYLIVAFDEGQYEFDAINNEYTFSGAASGNAYVAVDKDADLSKPVPASKVHTEYTVTISDAGTDISHKSTNKYLALACGIITFLITAWCSARGGRILSAFPFIIGIGFGYGFAAIMTVIGSVAGNSALMMIDFSVFETTPLLPEFTFIKAFQCDGDFGEFGGIGNYMILLASAYVPVAFVTFAEHIADHKNLSSIIGSDLLQDPGLHRTLMGDGVGSMVGAILGGCPNTTYGESVGCVAISGNASIITIAATSVLAMIAAMISPISAFLLSIPNCVIGGVCFSLYGFISVSGLKMIKDTDLSDNRNMLVVGAMLISGVGGLTLSFGSMTITAVACSLIIGILSNLMLSKNK